MRLPNHHPGLLFDSAPCAGHARAIAPGRTPFQTPEESGHVVNQAITTRAPALLRKGAGVDAQKTKGLCCAAAGIISPPNTHADSQVPHDRLRQAAPTDTTLIASVRQHAQPAKGYTHAPFTALTADEHAVCKCIADAINSTLAENAAGVFATVEEMALAIHDALLLAGSPPPENRAAAWLGQSGLYRTRLDAIQNGEQRVESVSADELIELASSQAREGHSRAQLQKDKCS